MIKAKVLELASFYPAPFCTRILHLLGAEVTKIEPPTGDPARALEEVFAVFNTGKKFLTLDLKNEKEKEQFFSLVKEVDVVVEGYRPGVAKKLGVDYENVSKVNPRIIYCSISAFGQNSKLSPYPAHDLNVLGLLGILEICGKGDLRDPNVQLADFSSAVFAVIAILSALFEREKTGKGKFIDLSMLKSAIFSVPIHTTSILNGLGILPVFTRNPAYEIYRTSDGFITIGIVSEEHFWQRMCKALDLNVQLSLIASFERHEELKELIKLKLEKMKTLDAIRVLRNADVPAFEVLSLKDPDKIEEVIGESIFEEIEFEGKKLKIAKKPF
ncbi:MAG: CoA transferase [Archaeoglobaceae archaeon]|nr:CoA transferase [Archaeoglobaceae archaeon]MDW8118852.1 CaiB/BaiF CoA-transferase family protein [Archaeoglobaceae archaeon]